MLDNVELDKKDKAYNADGHVSTGSDDRINVGNITINEGRDFMIQDSLK